jgi:hypothetical protein
VIMTCAVMQLSLERAATAPLASHQLLSYMIPENAQLPERDFSGKQPWGLCNAAGRNSPFDGSGCGW